MSTITHQQLQALLDSSTEKQIELTPGEYAGPITIRRSVVIEGKGATIWALTGPVVTIDNAASVELKHLKVEVTGESSAHGAHQEVAIQVQAKSHLDLDEVDVRGDVIGVPTEAGTWRYPKTLFLGCIPPMQPSEFKIRLVTGGPCKLVSEVSGVELSPSSLPGGPVEVVVRVDKLRRDTLLLGRVMIKTAFSRRWFMLNGEAAESTKVHGNDHIHWQPVDWDTINPKNVNNSNAPQATVNQPTSGASTTFPPAAPISQPAREIKIDANQSATVEPKRESTPVKRVAPNQLGIFGKPDSTSVTQNSPLVESPKPPSTPVGFPKLRMPGKSEPAVNSGSGSTEKETSNPPSDPVNSADSTIAPAEGDPKTENLNPGSKRLKPASGLFKKDT